MTARKPLDSGDMLGPYRVEALLGAGGMGEVYRASDTRLNRIVAIKLLPRESTADPERRQRLLREARAASALNHPNIVTLHDFATHDGRDYLVMEYVAGKPLEKLITPKPPPFAEALRFARQIAEGLAAAHAAGIVHRDMKPGNVVVSADGHAKILDFGLAKLFDRAPIDDDATQTLETTLTETGVVMGTPSYMSPEQACGKPLDHRTDIFSLGVILYELLAGSRPFRGATHLETMQAIVEISPTPLDVPRELGEIVDKALAKTPSDRYQHAGDMALDLKRFQNAWETKSLPGQRVPAAPFMQRRTPWPAVAAGAALVALAAAGAWRFSNRETWTNPLQGAQFTRFTDFDASEVDAAISPDGKLVAFTTDRNGRFDAYIGQVAVGQFVNVSNGRFPELFHETLRSVGFSADGSELWLRVSRTDPNTRNVSDLGLGIWLLPTMGGTPRKFLDRANSVSWSPEGTRITYFTPDPGDPIFIADRQGMNPRLLFASRLGEHTHFPTWSPDGKHIYFVRGFRPSAMDVWRVPSAGGAAERLTHHNSKVTYPAPLDDRTLLYIGTAADGDGSWLYAMDLKTRVTHRANLGVEDFISIAAGDGPNGPLTRLVATVSNPRGTLWTVPIVDRIAGESDVTPLALPTVRAVSPRYGPNYLLYLSSKGGGDSLWKLQDGVPVELWKPSKGTLSAPASPSPDGGSICFVVREGDHQRLYLMNSDGTGIRPLAEALDVREAASWSPDGKSIVASVDEGLGGRIYRIPVDGSAPERIVDEHSYSPVWSPDGRLILYYFAPQAAIFPVHAVTPDKKPVTIPEAYVRGDGGRFRFLPGGKSIVVLFGPYRDQNFYVVDLETGARRQLTNLKRGSMLRNFDISPDGKQIIFDRIQENSDVVLIDLPRRR